MKKTGAELLQLLADLGTVRGLSLVSAADGPNVLWNRLARACGVSDLDAPELRDLILRSRKQG